MAAELGSGIGSEPDLYTPHLTRGYWAYVHDIYDADTITCEIILGFGVNLHDQKIRLYGINAPELRGEEREEGLKSRDYLREKIAEKWVRLYPVRNKKGHERKGKYGRWLGIVVHDEVVYNRELVLKGYAKPYGD